MSEELLLKQALVDSTRESLAKPILTYDQFTERVN